MRTAARGPGRAGFTLVELLIATIIFAMVIAGFAAIYSSVFSQSGRVLSASNYGATANVTMRALQSDVSTASRLDAPAKGTWGAVLAGCQNYAPDGQPIKNFITSPPPPPDPSAFAYCVRPSAYPLNGCPAIAPPTPAGVPQGCLYSYRWNACPAPAVNTASCGTTIAGAQATLMARYVEPVPGLPYFSRVPTDSGADNGVRATFQVRYQPYANAPSYTYPVDLDLEAQYNGMWP